MSDYTVITDAGDIRGKRVLVRVDLNVPVEDGKVANDFRIAKSLATLAYLRDAGARVILLAHIGREATETLRPVYESLKETLPVGTVSGAPLAFVSDIFAPEARATVDAMQDGDIVLFENLRQHAGEEKNDPQFVAHLASFGELYVDEAFSNAHRDHASMTGLARALPSYAGIRFDQEVRTLSKAFNPPQPFLLIVGGAKFETKLPLVKKFASVANAVFIGGALSNDFFRFYGYETGKSLVSETPLEEIAALVDTGRIITPADVVVQIGDAEGKGETKDPRTLSPDDKIVDAGPMSVEMLGKLINSAKFIIWNGPIGLYEAGFGATTDALMKMVVDADAEAIVGGGDTAIAAARFEASDEQVFVSTAGGAMLDFLADEGKLPGIEALKR